MPTVTSLKTMFQTQIAPGNDEEFLRILQEADIRLLSTSKWRWTRGRVTLTPEDGFITLPSQWSAILGAQVDGYPVDIRDEQFEFSPDGPGEVPVGGTETVRLIDQGLNEDGERHYKVVGTLQNDTSIVALCHYAPVTLYDPTMDDSELPGDDVSTITRCPDASALKQYMLGIIYEEASDPGLASYYMNKAQKTLNDLEKTQRGGSRQTFNLRPNGPGISRIRSLR